MSKRIVVGLDPSDFCRAALELAVVQAKADDGTVVGVGIVDMPGIDRAASGAGVGASHFAEMAHRKHAADAEAKVGELLESFAASCVALGVRHETVRGVGVPAEVIGRAGLGADVIVVGLRTYFHFETRREPGDTLQELLRGSACPVLAVPDVLDLPWSRVLLPYDGSLMAARSMRAFVALAGGLPLERKVLLLRVDDDTTEGAELLRLPTEYLRAHGFEVEPRVAPGAPPAVVVAAAHDEQRPLGVLGISGKRSLRAWLFGSVTRALVSDGKVPLLVAG
jgi:nucleotide-binding universal stress UspA family protein